MLNDATSKSVEKYLSAILLLLIEQRDKKGEELSESIKIEVLLSRVGFKPSEIANMLHKKEGAIQKAIQRGNKQL